MLQSGCGGCRNRWQVSLSVAADVNVWNLHVVSKEAISSLTIWRVEKVGLGTSNNRPPGKLGVWTSRPEWPVLRSMNVVRVSFILGLITLRLDSARAKVHCFEQTWDLGQERTVIHYENNWIQLKELYREQLGQHGVNSSTFLQPSEKSSMSFNFPLICKETSAGWGDSGDPSSMPIQSSSRRRRWHIMTYGCHG